MLIGIAMAAATNIPIATYPWLASAGGLMVLTFIWSVLVAPQNLKDYARSAAAMAGGFLTKGSGDKDVAKGE
jgi:hypothetical protein